MSAGRGAFAALLVAGLAAAPGLTAQEPVPAAPTAPDTVAPPPAPPAEVPRVTFTVTVGTVGGGTLQTQRASAERLDEAGAVTSTTLLRRTVEADGGLQVGASARLALDRAWSIRVGVASGRARLRQALRGDDAALVREAGELPVAAVPELRVTTIDAALQLRIPSTRPFRPYAELGVARERWQSRASAEAPYPGGEGLVGGATRLAAHAALGADVPVTRALSARIQASVRAMETPTPVAPGGTVVAAGDTLVLTLQPALAGTFADPATEIFQRLRLDVGLSYAFGVMAPPREERSGEDAQTSARRR